MEVGEIVTDAVLRLRKIIKMKHKQKEEERQAR